jgi:hypothetical protein
MKSAVLRSTKACSSCYSTSWWQLKLRTRCLLLLLLLHQARRVLFPSRPPVRYDVLSIDTGITPAAAAVPGAAQHTTAVKPIDK